jgi:tetratricopeptide (TPR) repeat protein
MTKRHKAATLNARALALQKKGRRDEAIEQYQRAAVADPRWAVPLYNLGLLFKRERSWEESAEYNRRATEVDPKHEAAWWNMGIATTALGRWELARRAWRGFGIAVPDGDGPIDFPCGFGPIRLETDGGGEVVWAYRLDPARASLASIPFPESNYRWSDVVLNDGAPSGYRVYQGKEIPVLGALQLLERSPFGTYIARVAMPPDEEAGRGLADVAAELGGSAEDWTTSVRLLCQACSEGRPHQAHDTHASPPPGVHLIGVAARDRDHAAKILSTWEAGAPSVEVQSLEDALEPGPPE